MDLSLLLSHKSPAVCWVRGGRERGWPMTGVEQRKRQGQPQGEIWPCGMRLGYRPQVTSDCKSKGGQVTYRRQMSQDSSLNQSIFDLPFASAPLALLPVHPSLPAFRSLRPLHSLHLVLVVLIDSEGTSSNENQPTSSWVSSFHPLPSPITFSVISLKQLCACNRQ